MRVPRKARRSNKSTKGNQSCIFIGRTDAEAETSILRTPDAKIWLIRKDPDAGKDWRQDKKGKTEDEMIRWHHGLDGHEFEQAPGVGDAQGSAACCSLWSCTNVDMTERLNNNNNRNVAWVSIPMDRVAWWATVHGVTKTQRQVKQLTLHTSSQNIRSGFSRKDVFVLYIFCLRWSYCIAQGIIFNTL